MLKASFSSDRALAGANEKARFLLWRDIYVANIGSLDFKKYEDRRFTADLEIAGYGRVGLGRFSGTICSVERTAHDLSVDVRDEYCLMVNGGQETVAALHAGRETAIAPGGALLMSSSERGKLAARAPDAEGHGHVWHNIVVPGELMRACVRRPDDLLGVAQSGPAVAFLSSYLGLLSGMPDGPGPALLAHVETTLVDLVSIVVGAKGEAAGRSHRRGLRAVRTEACLAIIDKNYADPGFSARSIARQLGLSVRYVHDLLHATGVSFAERLLERRLQQARLLLSRTGSDHLRIGDLGLSVGFGDISYFNRCFRKRFGCAPNAFRAR